MMRFLAGIGGGSLTLTFLCIVGTASSGEYTGDKKDNTDEVKVIAQAASLNGKPALPKFGGEKVIMTDPKQMRLARVTRKRDELGSTPDERDKVESRLVELLKVKAIDWEKQMVVQVHPLASRNLREVRFLSLKADGKNLTVIWEARPTGELEYDQNSAGIALVPRFDGEIRFDKK